MAAATSWAALKAMMMSAPKSVTAPIAVVGVNYRLAPEHPFPAAFNDAWAVLQHLSGHYDKIIVGGDSAGGNLSAAVALKARDEGGPKIADRF